MTKAQRPNQEKITTTGWVGLWCTGDLGWRLTPYVSHRSKNNPARDVISGSVFPEASVTDRFFKVKITLEVMKDKRGRLISRRGTRKPFSVRVGAVKP